MNATVISRIVKIDDAYVDVEATGTYEGFPNPSRWLFSIRHNGKPEETVKHFHNIISKIGQSDASDYLLRWNLALNFELRSGRKIN
jgi:hypothetical protein